MDAVITPKSTDGHHRGRHRTSWLVPCALILVSAATLFIDVPMASVFAGKQRPEALDRPPLREVVEICEVFGHGFGATLIIIAVGVLDPLKVRCLPWLLAGSLGSGLAANVVKFFVQRTRPRDFDLTAGTVWETFTREANVGVNMQSFPSSHTATAVGLAVMLSSLYPQGRWFFSTLAFLVGMQRIVSSSHFPSDVIAGAAVGWLVGTLCVRFMMLPGGRLETRQPH